MFGFPAGAAVSGTGCQSPVAAHGCGVWVGVPVTVIVNVDVFKGV